MKNDDIVVKNSKIDREGIFAGKDFKKGEEITSDYSTDSIGKYSFKCTCGSKKCKGAVYY